MNLKYELYQLPTENPRCFVSVSKDPWAVKNLTEYEKVYEGTMEADSVGEAACEKLFHLHNGDTRPRAKEIRSMSVSDVVVLIDGGKRHYYACDVFGFTELRNCTPAFQVIITSERDVLCIHPCETMEDGIDFANKALRNWVHNALNQTLEVNEEGDYYAFASEGSLNAWSNLGSQNWDASIICVKGEAISEDPFEKKEG